MISVVIPTYRNKDIFLKNLSHNLSFLKECEVIVVNDDPSKSLKNDVGKFSTIILVENKVNLGFGQSVNIGVKKAKYKYVMLLNNDVVLNDESYKFTLKHFNKDSLLFAVSFAQKEKNNLIVGKNRIYWRGGMLYHAKANNLTFGSNAWAEGGAAIIDKEKFLALRGFDSLYSPFYWEDIDLSYRAYKRGWPVVFDPNIKVDHQHESTIGKYFEKPMVKTIAYRNQLIFIWKNITDWSLFLSHLFFLPYNLVYFLLKGEKEFYAGFFRAIKCLGKIIRQRKTATERFKVSDRHVLQLFS